MTAPDLYTPKVKELKVVTAGEAAMHAIPGQEDVPVMPDNKKETLKAAEAFHITFSYHNKKHRTKVLKAGSGNDAFYKVIINSHLHEDAGIYWLQHQPQGWVVLLGQMLDEQLISAIATAIETR